MGGYGSGTCWWRRTKPATDPALGLDVRWLARNGFLPHPGELRSAAVRWSSRGEVRDWIIVRSDGREPDVLVLEFRTRRPGEDWRDVTQRIALDRTPCAYGGSRPWFRCPRCGARCAVLWSVRGVFWCRACNDLAYSSTRESVADRALRRAGEIQKRLGNANRSSAWDWPPKPKGMHWRTYKRLIAELREREEVVERDFIAVAAKLCARFERREAKRAERPRSSG